MNRLFSDFFRINIGHVASAIIFLCGLIFAQAKLQERIALLDARDAAQHIAVTTAISTARSERNLQLESLNDRVIKVEGQQAAIQQLLVELRAVSVQVNTLKGRIDELRDDVRSIRDKK
jgi:SUMO ligase MMS21 Smc5/6 complex component